MKQSQYIAAIEIGSSKVVGAVAEINEGRINVKHLDEEKQINCVSYGQVQNVENIKACINRIIMSLQHEVDGTIEKVYVGMGGRSLHSEPCEVNRSIDATQAITNTTVKSIINEASRNGIKKYETIDAIPYEFFIDKKKVTSGDPAGQFGNSLKIKYNLIVGSSQFLLNRTRVTQNITSRDIITITALGQHVLTSDEKRLGCMLVDMGAETSSVAIYKDGMLLYVNTLPLGGRNITLDIATGLSQTEETAERIKKSINNPLDHTQNDNIIIEGMSSKDAANYINARTGEIIANINKQLEFAGISLGGVNTIVLTGGASQLKGVDKKLQEIAKINVRLANMPSNVYFDYSGANRPEYVPIMAIVAEAARIIDPSDSCVKPNRTYSDGDFTTTGAEAHDAGNRLQQQETQNTRTQQTETPKPVKKKGFWEKLKTTVDRVMPREEDEE